MSDISAVSGTTPTTSSSDGYTSTALQGIDKEMFLKLLVAQMQYQNPMSPVDSSEFLNQAAQYASVEQMENMATQQAELRGLQMITVATGMVGNEVTAVDPSTGEALTGTVSAVQFGGTEPMLVIGNVLVPVTAVVEMSGPPPAQAEAATTTASAPPAATADTATESDATVDLTEDAEVVP